MINLTQRKCCCWFLKLLLTGEIAQADEMFAAVDTRGQFTSGRRLRPAADRVDNRHRATRVHGDDDDAAVLMMFDVRVQFNRSSSTDSQLLLPLSRDRHKPGFAMADVRSPADSLTSGRCARSLQSRSKQVRRRRGS